MPVNRFFIDTSLSLNQEILLQGEEAHHLISVTRTRVDESVQLVNGKNTLCQARVIKILKKEALLLVEEVKEFPAPSHKTILIQALPRQNRLDTILEKGTELGMQELWLFPGEKSEKETFNEERARRIVLNAMKQCGRLDLPLLSLKPPLAKWSEKQLVFPAYFGDMDEGAPPFLKALKQVDRCSFFVGPESGFSETEVLLLNKWGVQGVKLHSHILRTDTAPLVALSVLAQQQLLL